MKPDRAGMSVWAQRLLPFLAWWPIGAGVLRGDLIAGITGALVLVPKAMAYAQLSGLPVHYGLYVAFVPALLGALWGSSRQLATGPVAIISLMTAAALTPLAAPMSLDYIELALLLTLMVGVIQFSLGALKLGTIVSFVSHPVILGFMNAAAIIIALSQIDMLLGIPKGRSDSFLKDVWEVLVDIDRTHFPTLAMAAFALALMLILKRIALVAKLSVLIAVAVTILVSVLIGYNAKSSSRIEHIADPVLREQIREYDKTTQRIAEFNARATAQAAQLRALAPADVRALSVLRHQLHLSQLDAADATADNQDRVRAFGRLNFARREPSDGGSAELVVLRAKPNTDERVWRITKIVDGEVQLSSGGDVVGRIPEGLPAFRVPKISVDGLLLLLSAAIIIALVGFLESIAKAKAMAANTRQRINANQELIGQGVANLGGAFFQSYPSCGSFTGSAINLQAGAQTGLAMVFNGLFVVATLLFLTPYLYDLPKATLAVIILLAVTSLITPEALKHTWRASRADGMVALVTFVITLLAAPHLDRGIMFGAALAVLLYLLRTMKPRMAELGRHPDGALRDLRAHPGIAASPDVIALRYDDTLYFANADFFEEAVLEALARKPLTKAVLIVGSGINQMDASGEAVVRELVGRLRASGIRVVFSSLKKQVLDVMRATGLYEEIGADSIFPNDDQALAAIYRELGRGGRGELEPAQTPSRSQATDASIG